MSLQTWTVGQFIERLKAFPKDAPLVLEDADTSWKITRFSVDSDDKEVCIQPSDYSEMENF